MRNTAVGLNYLDTYHRSGVYPIRLPSPMGSEAAGVVEAVGEGVTGLAPGDRVCTFGPQLGAYCTARNVPAKILFRTPDDVSDELAAAVLLKGCTAEFLAERCGNVQAGMAVLVHAAAGGVGQLLVQWLKHLGATVIATAGTAAKAELARGLGADHALLADEDIAARVRELTGGAGVRVVCDGIGMATWQASLGSVGRRGLIVSFGNASGPVTGVALGSLAGAGSIFVTRPGLFDYYIDPVERRAGAARMFELVANGTLKVSIGQRFALKDAVEAHRALESRATVGSTLLLP
jgi:NADPH2:quinone reductase